MIFYQKSIKNVISVLRILYNIELIQKLQHRLMKGSKNLKSQDSYKILKQITDVSSKINIELLIVVKQHVIACVRALESTHGLRRTRH